MRKPLALLIVVIATVGILAAGSADKAKTFNVTADTIEGCSCPLFCTCYFGPSADEHMCQFNNVYKFRKGSHYGNVDLSNQLLWLSGDLGGEWHKAPGPGMPGAWAVVTFDKSSTPEQKKALGEIAKTVFPVTWKDFAAREDSISWHDDAKMSHAKLASGAAEITLDKTSTLRPDKTQPVVVKNLQYWFSNSNDGFVLAHSTHRFDAEGTKFSHNKRNGFNIAWTSKGDIKPEAATKAAAASAPSEAASVKPEASKAAAHKH
jgi:hypothetical protein